MAFDLVLSVGWNMVTLPMGTAYKASTLGLTTGQVVSWNSATSAYKTFIVGLPLNDFNIVPTEGYWVFTSIPQTLHLAGTIQVDPQSRAITVPSGGGWVLVGFASMQTGWTASNVASMFTGASMTNVVRWNPATQSYTTYIVGLPLNNFPLVPGAAYWVFVTGSGTLTYSPI
jgi:hypothetical protein